MKKLTLIFTIVIAVLTIASCKKGEADPCTTECKNGGIVNLNCECNCPPGFTGPNCQTAILTATTVSINRDIFHILAPIKYAGDNEFAGNIHIEGSIKLKVESNNTKIYAVVDADYLEVGGDTKARINGNLSANRILLYTAPAGKKIHTINSDTSDSFIWDPTPGQTGKGELTYNNFVYKIELIGDTSGEDLPSDGSTANSRFKIWFGDFNITLANQ
jgi:hypothetical protein